MKQETFSTANTSLFYVGVGVLWRDYEEYYLLGCKASTVVHRRILKAEE
jgi:hypothetical protein